MHFDAQVNFNHCLVTRYYVIRLFRIMSISIMFHLFHVLMSEMLGRLLPVFTLLLKQRQHIIVVDAVDYM
jgi:hypothetical protein